MTTLAGLDLAVLSAPLSRVAVHLNHKPQDSWDFWSALGPRVEAYAKSLGLDDKKRVIAQLPLLGFSPLSFDALCKIRVSQRSMMHSSVERLYTQSPPHRVFDKIRSSVYRWGYQRAGWNSLVAAWTGFQRLDLGHPDFSLHLDYTTGTNEGGWSEHARVFLDGVFGLLIAYKGEHVMTVGFSFAGQRQLLVQQVQLVKRTGNRWLYQLPKERLEWVLDRLSTAWPTHTLRVVDGAQSVDGIARNYQKSLTLAQHRLADIEAHPGLAGNSVHDLKDTIERLGRNLAHLDADRARIAQFYRQTGRYRLGSCVSYHGLKHYRVQAQPH